MTDMLDYAAWIRRAEAFARGLNHLPGTWGISIDVAPPLDDAEANQIAASLPFSLPEPLLDFYTTASGKCCCRYHWSPDLDLIDTVDDVLSNRSIYGGPDFVHASELADHAEGAHSWIEGGIIDPSSDVRRAWIDTWLHTIPFVAVGNGDYVGLCCMPDSADMPVVYLCHDDPDGPVTFVSAGLEQFLADWEQLCYVGPEIWLLDEFLDEERRTLDVTGEKAASLRSLMETCGKAEG